MISEISKEVTLSIATVNSIYKYTRNADGRIEVLNPEQEDNWKLRQADGWTLDEFVNDIIGEIESYDNQYSHTYVPVTQKLVTGKGFMKTAHYDKVRTNNDPQKLYREYSQTNGIDTSIADPDVKSNSSSHSSSGNSGSSGGGSGSSGSSHNRSKSNSGILPVGYQPQTVGCTKLTVMTLQVGRM